MILLQSITNSSHIVVSGDTRFSIYKEQDVMMVFLLANVAVISQQIKKIDVGVYGEKVNICHWGVSDTELIPYTWKRK